jgi:hypothetical protein
VEGGGDGGRGGHEADLADALDPVGNAARAASDVHVRSARGTFSATHACRVAVDRSTGQVDAGGAPLTSTLLDYHVPVSTSMPDICMDHRETPSSYTTGGIKGMGEGGTNGAFACVVNAVCAALPEINRQEIESPLSPDRLWRKMQWTQRVKSGDWIDIWSGGQNHFGCASRAIRQAHTLKNASARRLSTAWCGNSRFSGRDLGVVHGIHDTGAPCCARSSTRDVRARAELA